MTRTLIISIYVGLLLASVYMVLEVGEDNISKHKVEVAEICDNYKSHFLGYYKDLVEASYARLAAEQCLGWNSCDSTKREIEGVLYGS